MRVCGICGRYFDGFVVKKRKKKDLRVSHHIDVKKVKETIENLLFYTYTYNCVSNRIYNIYMYIKE